MNTHTTAFPAPDTTHKMVTVKNPVDFKELAHLYHKKASSAAVVYLYGILLMSQTTSNKMF